MGTKKRKQQGDATPSVKGKRSNRRERKQGSRWTFGHLIVAAVGLFLVLGLGAVIAGHVTRDEPAANAGTDQQAEQAETDAYGRTPDHPHYGHPHP